MARLLTSSTAVPVSVTSKEIAERAYLCHEKHGCRHGHDVEDWLAAESSLLAEKAAQTR